MAARRPQVQSSSSGVDISLDRRTKINAVLNQQLADSSDLLSGASPGSAPPRGAGVTAIGAPAPAELAGPSLPAPLGVGSVGRGDPALRPIASAALRSLGLAVVAGLLILVVLPSVLVAAADR